jgi:hypothetical protein
MDMGGEHLQDLGANFVVMDVLLEQMYYGISVEGRGCF